MPSRSAFTARALALALVTSLALAALLRKSSAPAPPASPAAPWSGTEGMAGPSAAPRGTDFMAPHHRWSVEPPPSHPGHLLRDIHRITDVHAWEGGWMLLDGRSAHVVLLGRDGRPEGAMGREGQGPGELSGPAHVAGTATEIAVLDLAGARLDRYDLRGRPQPRLHLPRRECGGTLAEDLVAFHDAWAVLRRCTGPRGAAVEVLLVDGKGQVRELAVDSMAGEAADPLLRPLLLDDGGLYLGSTRDVCFRRIAGSGPPRRCLLPVPLRLVPDGFRRALEGSLAARARAVGMRLRVPKHLPTQLEVRSLGRGALAARRPVDERVAPWVVESFRGIRTLHPPEGVRVEPGPAGLLLVRDDLEGIRVWVLPPQDRPR